MPDLKITATVSIVVPFHNEEPNVIELYGRLQGVMEELGCDYQFVFVSSSVTALAIEQALAALGVPARLRLGSRSSIVRECNHPIAFAPQSGASVLNEIQYRWVSRNREAVIVLVLTVLAFAVRVHDVNFNSLSEDESAKWAAVTTPVPHPSGLGFVVTDTNGFSTASDVLTE